MRISKNVFTFAEIYKMIVENLKEVAQELKRFEKRLKEAMKRAEEDAYFIYGCKESGALKRAAMDLKNELTKITK